MDHGGRAFSCRLVCSCRDRSSLSNGWRHLLLELQTRRYQMGPFLSWLTAWWNCVGWIAVMSARSYQFLHRGSYPNVSILSERWFLLVYTTAGSLVAVVPNILDQRVLRWYFRITVCSACVLFMIYRISFPIASRGHLQPASGVSGHFYNGINYGPTQQASDAYCWIVGILFRGLGVLWLR